MPPAMHLLRHRINQSQWTAHPDFQALRTNVKAALARKRGAAFIAEDLLRQDYDTLPNCVIPNAKSSRAETHLRHG